MQLYHGWRKPFYSLLKMTAISFRLQTRKYLNASQVNCLEKQLVFEKAEGGVPTGVQELKWSFTFRYPTHSVERERLVFRDHAPSLPRWKNYDP